MKAPKLFFSDEKLTSVKRFYHLDYYYYIVFIIHKGAKNFDDIFRSVFLYQNELSDLSTAVSSREKFKTEYQIKSTLTECFHFSLIQEIDKKIELTEEGFLLLSHVLKKNFEESEKILCQKMELAFGRPSQLVNLFNTANKNGGIIVFPKPTPKAMNFSQYDLSNLAQLEAYCLKCSDYAFKEIKKHMNVEIDKRTVKNLLSASLLQYFDKLKDKPHAINISREVKKIMFSYYLNFFWPDQFDLTTFEVWIRRAKELRIINSTEFFPGANSLIIYPISLTLKTEVDSNEFITMAKTRSNEYLLRYEPDWILRKELFISSLWNNYIELSRKDNTFFIPVQDLRDVVCFKLQFSEQTFAKFLGLAYNESINETIKRIKISLEVDRGPQERIFVNSKRYPILINNVPKNIIGIKMN